MDQLLEARPFFLGGMLFGDNIVFELEWGWVADQWMLCFGVAKCWSPQVSNAAMSRKTLGGAIIFS